MDRLTDQTVLDELSQPVSNALACLRDTDGLSRVSSRAGLIVLGILRHLQGMGTLREQGQLLLHLSPAEVLQAPLARCA